MNFKLKIIKPNLELNNKQINDALIFIYFTH